MGDIFRSLFYPPPSVGLLLTVWTRFSVRVYDRAREAFLLPSIGLLEQFWNAITFELRASLLAGNPHGPREAFFVFFFSLCFCFCLVLYQVEIVPYCIYMITLRHKPLYIKRPQVKTVPYCIYTITFMHKPLYIKRSQVKTVPYCIYMITFMHRPQVKTVPYCNYSSRVETVQYIYRYYCTFFLLASRSTLFA